MSGELPDRISDRLELNNNRDLQQSPVAEAIYFGDRPYYNVRRVKAEIDGQWDSDTVRDRLDEMVEQGVLQREQLNRGNIYWLDRPESDWPIPSDVEVEPIDDEPSISEFFGQPFVKIASAGLLGVTVAGAIVLIGTFQAAGTISLPILSTRVLAYGLAMILLSHIAIIVAIIVWVLQKGAGSVHSIDVFDKYD